MNDITTNLKRLSPEEQVKETLRLEAELLDLLTEYENVIKPYYERKEDFLRRWVALLGTSFAVQNPADTKVYWVQRPKGKYISFPEFDIEKMIDADAKKLGFDVQRQPRKPKDGGDPE